MTEMTEGKSMIKQQISYVWTCSVVEYFKLTSCVKYEEDFSVK